MKSKQILQALTVCMSIGMLSAYVVYAQRRAQPSSTPQQTAEPAPADAADAEMFILPTPLPHQRSERDTHSILASSSKRSAQVISPVDVQEFEGFINYGDSTPPAQVPPAAAGSATQHVVTRPDGSTVKTFVSQERAHTFAPSSKVMINVFAKPAPVAGTPAQPVQLPSGTTVKPGTIQHGESLQIIATIPPPSAPTPSLSANGAANPEAPAQSPSPAQSFIPSTKSAAVLIPATPAAPASPAQQPAAPAMRPAGGIIFSTKSAPVFAPSPASPPAPVVPPGTKIPTAGQPTAPTIPAERAGRVPVDAAPPARPPETPKPRMIAPGSKSMDLLLLGRGTPQPAQESAAPRPAPPQAQQRGKTP